MERLTEALIEREVLTVNEIDDLIGKRAVRRPTPLPAEKSPPRSTTRFERADVVGCVESSKTHHRVSSSGWCVFEDPTHPTTSAWTSRMRFNSAVTSGF